MEISDFIPLIVIIGSIIYSIVSSVNKKKGQAAETIESENVDIEFPEILDNGNYRDIVFEKKETIKKPIQPKKKNLLPKTDAVFTEENESENFSFDFNEEDEIKKAIIYAEIFNRITEKN